MRKHAYDVDINVPFYSKFAGESTTGIIKVNGDFEAYYVDTATCSLANPKVGAIIGGAIAGNFRAALTDNNHVDFYKTNVPVDKVKTNVDINELASIIDQLPVTRITADHHQNIKRNELLAMLKASEKTNNDHHFRVHTIYELLRKSKILSVDNGVSMMTFAMYTLVAPSFAVLHLARIIAWSESREEFQTMLKDESGAAKQQQTIFRNDLSAVYELVTLRNRVYEDVDWEQEIEHRTDVKAVPISTSDVLNYAYQIFCDAKQQGKRPHRYEWDEYWKLRWSRFPGGSVVSQYQEDMRLKKQLKREAKIKCAWFSALPTMDHKQWLDRKPEIYASTSTKYEWGKVRALYGCDVTSFLHSDFAMPNCEDVLPDYFPVGKAANEERVNQVMGKFNETIPVCFDYDDFNSQHSKASMIAVLEAWKLVFSSQLSSEQVQSLQWIIESIQTMRVRFNDLQYVSEINGTLLSGWRLTTFINTVLNRVYLLKAGLAKFSIYALHNGDDVFAGCANIYDAACLVRSAYWKGIRAQVSKTNIGTIGEFLRIDTRAKDPTSRQYLSRSVATAVHGRVETSAPNDLFAITRANDTRMSEIIQRGGNAVVVKAALRELDKFIITLFNSSDSVIGAYRQLHPVQGGCNERAETHLVRLIRKTKPISEDEVNEYFLIRPGVYDYINSVISKFKLPYDIVSRRRLMSSAVSSLMRDKVSYELVIEDRWNVINYRMMYKAWSKSGYVPDISRIRSLGLVVAKEMHGLEGPPVSIVRNSYDPLMTMQYAF